MLDNRKIEELPEITGKMVKVRSRHTFLFICRGQCLPGQTSKAVGSALNSLWKWIPLNFRASSVWCFMTDDFSTQSTNSWKAGAGTGLGIASSTWVSLLQWLHKVLVLTYCTGPVGGKNVAVQPCIYINPPVGSGYWLLTWTVSTRLRWQWCYYGEAIRTLLITACFYVAPLQISPCPSA